MLTSSNSRLQIFVDPSGTDSPVENSLDSWQDIGTRKSRVKENVPEVKKIAGTALKQAAKSKRIASTSAYSSGSKIAIYREPGPGVMPPPAGPSKTKTTTAAKPPPPKTPAETSFRPFVDEPSAATLVAVPIGHLATPKFTPFKDDVGFSVEGSYYCIWFQY
jgi:hypothetical protein